MKKIINLILILVWMIVVFTFSNQDGEESGGLSGRITEKIDNIFQITEGCTEQDIEIVREHIDSIIRKIAHFSLYAIGGFLVYLEINRFKFSFILRILLSQLVGSIYACTDEIHQSFIPERSGELRDVLIDSCGVLAGIIVAIIIILIINKIKEKFKLKQMEEEI